LRASRPARLAGRDWTEVRSESFGGSTMRKARCSKQSALAAVQTVVSTSVSSVGGGMQSRLNRSAWSSA
jgi:hypothetical protein